MTSILALMAGPARIPGRGADLWHNWSFKERQRRRSGVEKIMELFGAIAALLAVFAAGYGLAGSEEG